MRRILLPLLLTAFTALSGVEDNGKAPKAEILLHPACFQNDSFAISESFPGVIYLLTAGGPWQQGTFTIDLAPHIGLAGSSYLWDTARLPGFNRFAPKFNPIGKTVLPDGKIRHTVELSAQMMRDSAARIAGHRFTRLYFTAQTGSAGKITAAPWTFSADSKLLRSGTLNFKAIPPLTMPQKPTRDFAGCITFLYSSIAAPTPEMRRTMEQYWTKLSSADVWTALHGYLSAVPQGYAGYIALPSQYGMPAFRPHPFERAVRTGKLLDKYPHADKHPLYANRALSSAYINEDPDGVVDKYFREGIAMFKKEFPHAKYIFWNFEPSVLFSGELDRKRFCEKLKLPRTLTFAEIKKDHYAEWKKFAFDQSTATIKKVSDAFRRDWPTVKLIVCGANLTTAPDMRDAYCSTDPRDYDKFIDWHMPMSYRQDVQFFDDSARTVQHTKKPVMILVDPNEIRKDFYSRYTPKSLRQSIPAAAAMGARGIGFYPYESYDAEYLQAIADGFSAVAAVEDVYLKGREISAQSRIEPANAVELTISGSDGKPAKIKYPELASLLRYRVHVLDKRCVVSLFNYFARETLIVRINVPGFYRDVLAEVKPGECTIVDGVKDQSALQTKLAAAIAKLKKESNFPSVGNSVISSAWRALDQKMQPAVLANKHTLIFDKSKGTLISWLSPSGIDMMRRRNVRGHIGAVSLLENGEMVAADEFRVNDAKLADDSCTVSFSHTFRPYVGADIQVRPLEKVRVTQQWTAKANAIDLTLTTTVRNESDRTVTTALRCQNYPRIGWYIAHGDPITSIGSVKVGKNTVKSGGEMNNLFLLPGVKSAWPAMHKLRAAEWDGSALVMRAAKGKSYTNLTVTPDRAVNTVYSWWLENDSYSMETVTGEFTLPPGGEKSFTSHYNMIIR